MRGKHFRHARLRPEFAHLYPEFTPDLWLSAGGVAMRVAARIWKEAGAEAVISRRVLSDEHFRFRGGA